MLSQKRAVNVLRGAVRVLRDFLSGRKSVVKRAYARVVARSKEATRTHSRVGYEDEIHLEMERK
jgi:hypothetical protein